MRINPRIKLRHLLSFAAVARHRGIARAARELCLTHAAVSKTLSELEEILDAPLLNRGGRGVSLTPFGDLFLRHAGQGLAAIRQGEEAVARGRGGFKIALGALPNAAARIVPLAVLDFMRENPAAVARIVIGGNAALLAMLKTGELDLLVGRLALPKDMKGVNFEHLYSERLALAARPGHPLFARRRRSRRQILKEVGRHIVIFPPPETRIREDADRLFIQSGAPLPARWAETNSTAVARGMALDGDAVWCVPLGAVAGDLKSGILKEVPADMSATMGAVGMSVRADALPSPQCAALMEKIRQAAGGAKNAKF
jgi:LysR family pca operon transcriptional activator